MPIDKQKLLQRKWPTFHFPLAQEIIDRIPKGEEGEIKGEPVRVDDYGARVTAKKGFQYEPPPWPEDYLTAYQVSVGRVDAVALPFEPGECAVKAMVKTSRGVCYGITGGAMSHLFSFDPAAKTVTPQGRLDGMIRKNGMAPLADGAVLWAAHLAGGEGWLYVRSEGGSPEKICCPVKGEGIAALASSPDGRQVYGISDRSGVFFVYDSKTRTVAQKGAVDRDGLFSSTLAVDDRGDVYGGARWTRLFKYDARNGTLAQLETKAPLLAGREMYTRIDALLFDPRSRSVFGGTSDGMLFQFHPENGKMISLGKILNQPRIRCLTMGGDGCLYGIAGKDCCHLFRYNPADRDLRDLGMLFVASPRAWNGYEFDAAVTGPQGEVCFGENDQISHVFVYSPS